MSEEIQEIDDTEKAGTTDSLKGSSTEPRVAAGLRETHRGWHATALWEVTCR